MAKKVLDSDGLEYLVESFANVFKNHTHTKVKDAIDGRNLTFAYGRNGTDASNVSYLAAWKLDATNGMELVTVPVSDYYTASKIDEKISNLSGGGTVLAGKLTFTQMDGSSVTFDGSSALTVSLKHDHDRIAGIDDLLANKNGTNARFVQFAPYSTAQVINKDNYKQQYVAAWDYSSNAPALRYVESGALPAIFTDYSDAATADSSTTKPRLMTLNPYIKNEASSSSDSCVAVWEYVKENSNDATSKYAQLKWWSTDSLAASHKHSTILDAADGRELSFAYSESDHKYSDDNQYLALWKYGKLIAVSKPNIAHLSKTADSGWTDINAEDLITRGFLSSWNGLWTDALDSSGRTQSVLSYCSKGEFGTVVTRNIGYGTDDPSVGWSDSKHGKLKEGDIWIQL